MNPTSKFLVAVAQGTASEKLDRFLRVQWDYLMHEFPEWATFVGYPGQNTRWTDLSLEAIERRLQESELQIEALRNIERNQLTNHEQVSWDLALYELEMSIEGQKLGQNFMPINHMDNLQTKLVDLLAAMPHSSSTDFSDLIARLETFPENVRQTEILMREGLARGMMPFRDFMADISLQISDLLSAEQTDNPLLAVFSKADSATKARASQVLHEQVDPALRTFQDFFEKEYAPKGRTYESWSSLPNGKNWYSYLVRLNTTTRLTPDEIHQMGLHEVARINQEMDRIRMQVGFHGDRVAFRKHLLSSPEFCYKNPEDLLEGYRVLMRKIHPQLKNLFGLLPKTPCEVRAMPEFRAKTGPGGQYFSGSLEANRPGYFEANTFDLPSRPKWEMETLTLHETIPGHHFQISIAKEAKSLPDFRQNVFYTAYGEGWALYAESLGPELGLFSDPYSKFGYLAAEMLRSVRLVVDTGLHAMGWSRAKALDYFRDNVPATDHDSQNEINRYVAWPAQALGYKVGELKIQEFRRSAEKSLGSNFSLPNFHDELLKHGCLPLSGLEKIMINWIQSQGVKYENVKDPRFAHPGAHRL